MNKYNQTVVYAQNKLYPHWHMYCAVCMYKVMPDPQHPLPFQLASADARMKPKNDKKPKNDNLNLLGSTSESL
jgi:hypothetical protein